MALDSKAGLKSAIVAHLERDDLNGYIDDFIVLAEARLRREVRMREMLVQDEIVIYDRLTDLPDDFLALKSLQLRSVEASARRYYPDFEERSYHELAEIAINAERRPRCFTIHQSIEVDSQPDRAYLADMLYYKDLEALDDDDDSNVILQRAPDLYLYASLLATAPFLMHDERLTVWGQLYQDGRDALNKSERDSRRGGPLFARVQGPTP